MLYEVITVDLANCLIAMGANIVGAGTDRICVQGVKRLQGATYSVMPDRIETGTFLCAAAASRGNVTLARTSGAWLDSVIET